MEPSIHNKGGNVNPFGPVSPITLGPELGVPRPKSQTRLRNTTRRKDKNLGRTNKETTFTEVFIQPPFGEGNMGLILKCVPILTHIDI